MKKEIAAYICKVCGAWFSPDDGYTAFTCCSEKTTTEKPFFVFDSTQMGHEEEAFDTLEEAQAWFVDCVVKEEFYMCLTCGNISRNRDTAHQCCNRLITIFKE